MASPYILTNHDLTYTNVSGQQFSIYLAFLNPIAITTNWLDLPIDAQGNYLPPPNTDTAASRIQPYAPTANMGSNRIGFVGEPMYFDGSRSCQRHDVPVVSYTWTFGGNPTITPYHNNSQCSAVWNAPGLYTVSLTVKDHAGTATTAQRQVMVYQDRGSALPGVIGLSGLSGSLQSGGWTCQVETLNTQVSLLQPEQVPVGSYQPIVMLAETSFEVAPGIWVPYTLGPHGQFNPGYPYQDPRILFDGYIQNGSVHQDVDKDTLTFTCVGPQYLLQEVKAHPLGYWNGTYKGNKNNVPTGINSNSHGTGYLVGGLMTADVIHSILQTHSTVGTYHDIHCWNANIPAQPYQSSSKTPYYNLAYTNLSINEGTLWTNIQALAQNEYADVHCEYDGSIRVGPQVNYRGGDYWSQPTLLGPTAASALLNFAQDIGLTVSGTVSQLASTFPTMPSMPFPVQFIHPWGHQPNPPQMGVPFQGQVDATVSATQSQLSGPPILCVFSDTPVYDASSSPPSPGTLYPWIVANWPQDLAVYPVSFDVQENYTGRAALVKLVGTLYGHSSQWTAWYPTNSFVVSKKGTATTTKTVLPAGDWQVHEGIVLPDITSGQNASLVWNWWWELARREYYARNINYTASVTLTLFTAASLGDVVALTRQNNSLGPHWLNKLFYVNQVDYTIDLTNHTWSTQLSLSEVTSVYMTPIQKPPTSMPKG